MSRTRLTTGLRPVHPGELLREDVLPALGRPRAEIARLLGISRQSLYDLIDEKQAVTASTALRIGKLTGTTAESWMRLQQAFDLKTAERTLGPEIERIPTLEAVE